MPSRQKVNPDQLALVAVEIAPSQFADTTQLRCGRCQKWVRVKAADVRGLYAATGQAPIAYHPKCYEEIVGRLTRRPKPSPGA